MTKVSEHVQSLKDRERRLCKNGYLYLTEPEVKGLLPGLIISELVNEFLDTELPVQVLLVSPVMPLRGEDNWLYAVDSYKGKVIRADYHDEPCAVNMESRWEKEIIYNLLKRKWAEPYVFNADNFKYTEYPKENWYWIARRIRNE